MFEEIIYHSTRDDLCSIHSFMYIFHIVRAQTSVVQAISFIDILLPVVRFRSSRELLNNALRNTLRFVSPIPLLFFWYFGQVLKGICCVRPPQYRINLLVYWRNVKRNCGMPISKDLKVRTYFRNPKV